MTKQLYIIQYDSAHFCRSRGESHCVVWAENADHAVEEASIFMEEHMRELFSDEYGDEYDEETETGFLDDESAVSVNWCELLDSEHEHWPYYTDPTQGEFYPVIGSPE